MSLLAFNSLPVLHHRFIHSIAGCVTGQSHTRESCDTQGAIIGVQSMYIFSLDSPPQNVYHIV